MLKQMLIGERVASSKWAKWASYLEKRGKKRAGNFIKFLRQEILLLQWNFLGYCCSSTTESPYFQGKLPVDFVVHRYIAHVATGTCECSSLKLVRWIKSNKIHSWPVLPEGLREWFVLKEVEECFSEHRDRKNNRDRSTGVTLKNKDLTILDFQGKPNFTPSLTNLNPVSERSTYPLPTRQVFPLSPLG